MIFEVPSNPNHSMTGVLGWRAIGCSEGMGRAGELGRVARYVRESFDCTALTVSNVFESL